MKNKNRSFFLAISFILVAAICNYFMKGSNSLPINYDIELGDFSTLLTSFLIITLVIERFADSVISGPRRFEKQNIQDAIDACDAQGDQEGMNSNKKNLTEYRNETFRQVMQLNFVLGLLIALAGFRIFDAITYSGALEGVQLFLFQTVDIAITAGFIAGGSKGVNTLSDAIEKKVGPR